MGYAPANMRTEVSGEFDWVNSGEMATSTRM